MVKKARKKPVVVEFIQFNGTNATEIEHWMGQRLNQEYHSTGERYLFIPTLEGEMRANPYDYIIKGVNGEFYPCKPFIFEKRYDVVEE